MPWPGHGMTKDGVLLGAQLAEPCRLGVLGGSASGGGWGPVFPPSSSHDLIMASMPLPECTGSLTRRAAGATGRSRSCGECTAWIPWPGHGMTKDGVLLGAQLAEPCRLGVLGGSASGGGWGPVFPPSSSHDLIMASMPLPECTGSLTRRAAGATGRSRSCGEDTAWMPWPGHGMTAEGAGQSIRRRRGRRRRRRGPGGRRTGCCRARPGLRRSRNCPWARA